MTTTPENIVKKQVMDALMSTGKVKVFRNNVGGRKYKHGLKKGSGDLIGYTVGQGRFVSFEIKTKTGVPSDEQLAWMAEVNADGGYACIVTSADDALASLQAALSSSTVHEI